MKKLIIEIGTNSIKCLSASWKKTGWKILSDSVHPTRLGEGLAATGKLSEEAMARNLIEIGTIIQTHPEFHKRDIHLIATQSMRQAANAKEFDFLCKQYNGSSIETLPGKQEAQYSYLAVVAELAASDEMQAVLDIGGGSTELAIGEGTTLSGKQSLPIGAVNLTERFISSYPVSDNDLSRLQEYVSTQIQEYQIAQPLTRLTGVGGTLVTLLLLDYPEHAEQPQALEAMALSQTHIAEKIALFQSMTLNELNALPGMPKGRADIILAGSVVAQAVLKLLGLEKTGVSTKGVRHGYLYALQPDNLKVSKLGKK